jgi:hypothetical protein
MEEEFEDTKGVIRIHKSKNDKKQNGQNKSDKRKNNDLQYITHKTKENKKYYIVGTTSKSNRKFVERGRINKPIQISTV